jgi:hypothetical protein
MRTRSTQSATPVGMLPTIARWLNRPRISFDRYTAPLMTLYQSYTQELYVSGLDPAAVLSELTAYATAAAAEQVARIELKKQQNAKLLHASHVWSAMLAVYERAKIAARTNPAIRAAIAEFESFMHVKRSRRTSTTPATTPVAV